VSWKCWTNEQLAELSPYFLTPGMSVVLEIGLSTLTPQERQAVVDVSDPEQVRELFYNRDPSTGQAYTINGEGGPIHPIRRRVLQGGGKYELFVGTLGEPGIEFNDQGGFDCTSEILGIPQSIMGLRAVSQTNRRNDNSQEQGGKKKPTLWEFIKEDNSKEEDQGLASIQSDEAGAGNWGKIGDTEFLSWQAFEEKVLNPYLSYRTTREGGQEVWNFNSDGSVISYFPELLTTDAKTCVVVPSDTGLPGGGVLRAFPKGASRTAAILGTQRSQKRGNLYNLYVSKQLIKDVAKEKRNAPVMEIVIDILERCSTACFGIWDFKIAEEGNNWRVIDRNALGIVEDAKSDDQIFRFRPFTDESVVTGFSIDVTLDDLVKSQIMAGSRVQDEGRDEDHVVNSTSSPLVDLFGRVEDPIFPRTFYRNAEPRQVDGETANPTQESPLIQRSDPRKEAASKVTDLAVSGAVGGGFVTGFQEIQFTEEEARALRQDLLKDTRQDSPVNANKNLPIDVSFDTQGIGGIRKYHVFDVDNLPRAFSEGVFMVKQVSHSVDRGGWSTSVSALYSVRNLYTED
jgi:hypothetical protein